MKKWWIVPLLMILVPLCGFPIWLWSMRPVVTYTLGDYPEMLSPYNTSFSVQMAIKNTGSVFAMVDLILSADNANISVSLLEIGMECNGTHLIVHYDLPNQMDTEYTHYANIEPLDGPQNFTLNLTLDYSRALDWSFPNGWIRHWLEPHGYVTHLTYNRTETGGYQLLTSSS